MLKVASQLKKKGVVFTEDVKKEGWGTYGMFKDLDGNEFWLLEGGPKKTDSAGAIQTTNA